MNRYFVCIAHEAEPIPWHPTDSDDGPTVQSAYFGRVLSEAVDQLRGHGWTFYLTWDISDLPEYGPHVVAIVMGDEWCRIPAYAHRIAATFKCYGTKPTLPSRSFSYRTILEWAHFVQVQTVRLPGVLRARWLRARGVDLHLYDIPLGYANQTGLPLKDFESRTYDVSFVGSPVHREYPWYSPKRWLHTPKILSRRKMISAMTELSTGNPDLNVYLRKTPNYKSIRQADPVEYSTTIMNTRIYLVPRGTSIETFRFFEALRFGCVVICETLPDRWFYDDSPVIRVDDWRRLSELIPRLVADGSRLQRLHHQSLAWWNDVCSEAAVGTFMARILNERHPNAGQSQSASANQAGQRLQSGA